MELIYKNLSPDKNVIENWSVNHEESTFGLKTLAKRGIILNVIPGRYGLKVKVGVVITD